MNYDKHKGYEFSQEDGEVVEIKSTYKLQMKSLESFAECLGYELNNNMSFEYAYTFKTDKPIIGFKTMVDYHNLNFGSSIIKFEHPMTMEKKSEKLNLDFIDMEQAIKSKLVKQVHLQRKKSKKIRGKEFTSPEIQVQSHIIRFA